MTQPGETDGYFVEDHVNALLSHGAVIDGVVVANDELPIENVLNYQKEGSTPVRLKYEKHEYEVIMKNLLSFEKGLIRHDANKVNQVIRELLEEV